MRVCRAALAFILVACIYDPTFDGHTRCSSDGDCPAGRSCDRGSWTCVAPDAGPSGTPQDAPAAADAPEYAGTDAAFDGAPPPADGPAADVRPDLAPDRPPDPAADRPRVDGSGCMVDVDCYAGVGPVCEGRAVLARCRYDTDGCLGKGDYQPCRSGFNCLGDPPNAACVPIVPTDASSDAEDAQ
jgi:hypothetical protein